MRWKLLIITSCLAALLGSGGDLALIYIRQGFTPPLPPRGLPLAGLVSLPLITGTLACVFVYRHTARRRKLQLVLAALFSLILTLAILCVALILLIPPAGAAIR